MSSYERFAARYAAGPVPWDDEAPPPEVVTLTAELRPGRALDLGCGFGRAAVYLARHGWRVDGVDFIPQAIAEARARAEAAGVSQMAHFHLATVTDLHFLAGPYDLALDVGCMHALNEVELPAYRDGLIRLLRPNARYLLFARLRQAETEEEDGPRGIPEATIYALFATTFALERVVHGLTQIPPQGSVQGIEDKPAWASAWFWFRRLS